MVKNLGSTDKIIRSASAAIIFLLILTGNLAGAAAWILGLVGVVLLATSFMGFCPLYKALNFSTNKAAAGKK